jgi:hypothetical protein
VIYWRVVVNVPGGNCREVRRGGVGGEDWVISLRAKMRCAGGLECRWRKCKSGEIPGRRVCRRRGDDLGAMDGGWEGRVDGFVRRVLKLRG